MYQRQARVDKDSDSYRADAVDLRIHGILQPQRSENENLCEV